MRKSILAFALLSMACVIHAQEINNVSINARVGLSQGLGYENPRIGLETSLKQMVSKRMGFSLTANVDSARKVTGGGHSEALQGTLRFYRGDWFVGAGLAWNRQATSFYAKAAASPLIEAGFIHRAMTVRLFIEPYDFVSVNHMTSGGFSLDYYAPTVKRYGWHLGFSSRIVRGGCIQGAKGLTDTCVGGSAAFSFGIYWKLKRPQG